MRSRTVRAVGGTPESEPACDGLTAVPHGDRSVDRLSAAFDRKHSFERAVAPSGAPVGNRQSKEVVDDHSFDRSGDRDGGGDPEGPPDRSSARSVEIQSRVEGVSGEEDSTRVRPVEVERVAGLARAGRTRTAGDSRRCDDGEQGDSGRCNSGEQVAVQQR